MCKIRDRARLSNRKKVRLNRGRLELSTHDGTASTGLWIWRGVGPESLPKFSRAHLGAFTLSMHYKKSRLLSPCSNQEIGIFAYLICITMCT